MIKVKEFYNYSGVGIDTQINNFIEKHVCDVIDIKYQITYDSKYGNYRSSALLIYIEQKII